MEEKIIQYSVQKIGDNNYKVQKKQIDWNNLITSYEEWHKELADIILNKEALYFFATNNKDSLFMKEELSAKQKSKMQEVLKSLIKNPENYHEDFQKRNDLYEESKTLKTNKEIETFITRFGIDFKCDNKKEFKNNINRLQKKLTADYGYGLFGEILFYIVVEKLMRDINLILSKISFITAPGTFSHGSDGIFCEYDKKILYFGEAKFTLDLSSGIEQAINSIKNYEERLKQDITFIVLHNRDLKNGYEEKEDIIEKEELEKFSKKILIFLLHGKEYETSEILEILKKKIEGLKNVTNDNIDFEIISFPIIDKNSLKNKIAWKVENYDKCC